MHMIDNVIWQFLLDNPDALEALKWVFSGVK